MDRETRLKNVKKLDAMLQYVGYPEEVLDMDRIKEMYQGLSIDTNGTDLRAHA